MKAIAIVLSIIAFAICLIIGIQAGSRSTPPPTPAPTGTPNIWLSPSEQRTYAVLVADDLQSAKPRLLSAWFVIYRPDLPQVTFVPLYPAMPNYPTPPDLAGRFVLMADKRPAASFFNALNELHVKWKGYLLTDQKAVSQAIDWMEGVEIDGEKVTGAAAIERIAAAGDDPQATLAGEAKLLQGICKRTTELPVEANWVGLAETLSPQHLQTDLDLALVISDWRTLVSADSPMACTIPEP